MISIYSKRKPSGRRTILVMGGIVRRVIPGPSDVMLEVDDRDSEVSYVLHIDRLAVAGLKASVDAYRDDGVFAGEPSAPAGGPTSEPADRATDEEAAPAEPADRATDEEAAPAEPADRATDEEAAPAEPADRATDEEADALFDPEPRMCVICFRHHEPGPCPPSADRATDEEAAPLPVVEYRADGTEIDPDHKPPFAWTTRQTAEKKADEWSGQDDPSCIHKYGVRYYPLARGGKGGYAPYRVVAGR